MHGKIKRNSHNIMKVDCEMDDLYFNTLNIFGTILDIVCRFIVYINSN